MDIIQNLQDLIASVPTDSIPGLIVVVVTALGLLTVKILDKKRKTPKEDD